MVIPPLILLELRLRALKPIRKLPHFLGPHFSAMLRHLLREALPDEASLAQAGVWLQTVESGIVAYEEGEPIGLGLTFPAELAPCIGQALAGFNETVQAQGHFQPGVTVALDEVWCRISDAPWDRRRPCPLTAEILAPEVERLLHLDRWSLLLQSPLRLTRPAGAKAQSHRYVDEDYLDAARREGHNPLEILRDRMRLPGAEAVDVACGGFHGGGCTWLDVPYGNPKGKSLGGLIGRLHFSGRLTPQAATLLVAGQYFGSGKNAPFGFGFYDLPELAPVRRIAPLRRGRTLFERAVQAAPTDAEDRVHRALAVRLTPAVEGLLSHSAYAYRQGLSRRSAAATLKSLLGQGYDGGIKADIAAFFDSVRHDDLLDLLAGYFPAEPAVGLIAVWLATAAEAGAEGLPQGGILSPVLSNLYLDRFDRAMAAEGFRLVRFADDFVVLFRSGQDTGEGVTAASRALGRLGLALQRETSEELVHGQPLRFLGRLVAAVTVKNTKAAGRRPQPKVSL